MTAIAGILLYFLLSAWLLLKVREHFQSREREQLVAEAMLRTPKNPAVAVSLYCCGCLMSIEKFPTFHTGLAEYVFTCKTCKSQICMHEGSPELVSQSAKVPAGVQ